jgi:predicted outer membrane repeat protein
MDGGSLQFEDCVIERNEVAHKDGVGGGFLGLAGEVVFVRCHFEGNRTEGSEELGRGGGAIAALQDTSCTVRECTFFENWAKSSGAAIQADVGPLDVSESLFDQNRADGWWSNGGGAVAVTTAYIDGTYTRPLAPRIIRCTFVENRTWRFGAALYVSQWLGDLFVEECAFRGNRSRFSGGAVYVSGDSGSSDAVQLIDCVFEENSTREGDGGAFLGKELKALTMAECLFSANNAGRRGGAVAFHSTSEKARVLDCVFEGNQASLGGGLATYGLNGPSNTLHIENSRFVGNSAETGAACHIDSDYTVDIANTVFASNAAASGGGLALYGVGVLLRFCTFTQNAGGEFAAVGALSGAYAEGHGCIAWGNGPIVTVQRGQVIWRDSLVEGMDDFNEGVFSADPRFREPDAGDYRLLYGSPAMDAMAQSNHVMLPDRDIRGIQRPAGGAYDLGAYELLTSLDLNLDPNGDRRADAVDVQWVINAVLGIGGVEVADVDGDGAVNAVDVQLIINAVLGVV